MTKLQTILDSLASLVREGITTAELEKAAASAIAMVGCQPAFLHYQPEGAKTPYPFVSCISIDEEVVHGLPSSRKIEDGQLVKIDLGLVEDGQYDDGALTVMVGKCSATARRLVAATREALEAGVQAAKAGNTTHDIARAISAIADREGLGIVENFSGHGIGEKLHLPPNVPNRVEGAAVKLEAGMRLAIEPMFSSKRGKVYIDKNDWTVKLVGGGVAAHFERTVTIH